MPNYLFKKYSIGDVVVFKRFHPLSTGLDSSEQEGEIEDIFHNNNTDTTMYKIIGIDYWISEDEIIEIKE